MNEYLIYNDEDFGSIKYFTHEESNIIGINDKPFISLDSLNIDLSEINIEICKGLAISSNFNYPLVAGQMPPKLEYKFPNLLYEPEIYCRLDELDPIHRQILKELKTKDKRRKYLFFALNLNLPWMFSYYLKYASFTVKTNDGLWTEESNNFPKLKEMIYTLPFKLIGRVVIYGSFPRAGVPPHRDSFIVEKHMDHHINFFPKKSRPAYVYDTINDVKEYLDDSQIYIFNNRDYHGVDPEDEFNYTLRVDGIFTDDFSNIIGLENGEIK